MYLKFPANLMGGETSGESVAIDVLSDDLRVSNHTVVYVPNQDLHETVADLSGEVTGTNMPAGGIALTGRTIVLDTTLNKVWMRAADSVWSLAVGSGIRYSAVADRDATKFPAASQKPLVGYIDWGADQAVNGTNFTITWPATTGLIEFTVL